MTDPGTGTVSYTHLDVYKRQALVFPIVGRQVLNHKDVASVFCIVSLKQKFQSYNSVSNLNQITLSNSASSL